MGNIIACGILIFIIGCIIFKMLKERKKGNRCCGCPCSKTCKKSFDCEENKCNEK